MTFTKSKYDGLGLRMDGYYYAIEGKEADGFKIYYFYRDGTIHTLGAFASSGFSNLDSVVSRTSLIEKAKKIKIYWGLYKINNDSISYEMWYPKGHELIPYINKGVITSDTTFEIREWMRYDGTEREAIREVFNFRKYHPKPDSTNDFLK